MTWNYRVIHRRYEDANVVNGRVFEDQPAVVDTYAIHEVYYDAAGAITGWTANAIPAHGESLADVRWALAKMRRATREPVLEYADLPGALDPEEA